MKVAGGHWSPVLMQCDVGKGESFFMTTATKEKQSVFTMESVPKAVLTLALPSVLSMLVTVLYNMVDTVFVGQTHDPYQMNAVSMATPIFMMLMAIGNLFGIGACAFVSRSLGAGQKERVKTITSFSFWSTLVFGAAATIFMTVGCSLLLPMLGADAAGNIAAIPDTLTADEYERQCQNYYNLEQYTKDYLFYIGLGAIPTVLSGCFSHMVKGEGAAKISMIGMMIGAVTNIILDPIMILTMDMGVKGAAIATSIGNLVSLLFYFVYLLKSNTMLSISPKRFTIGNGIAVGVMAIGIPTFLTNLLMSFSNVILNRFLNNIDVLATGGMGIAMKANMLLVFLQMGIAMGIQPLVGYQYGAGNFKKMQQIIRFSTFCTVAVGVTLTIVYFIFTEPLVGIFMTAGSTGSISDVTAQTEYAVKMLRALMLSAPVLGILFVNNFSLQAMGKGLSSLLLSVSRQGFIFLPVLLLANRFLGLDGLIYAQPIADIISVVVAVLLVARAKKQAASAASV